MINPRKSKKTKYVRKITKKNGQHNTTNRSFEENLRTIRLVLQIVLLVCTINTALIPYLESIKQLLC